MDARQIAMYAYYYGTYPIRANLRRQLRSTGQVPLCVLFYHRVSETHANDWTIGNAAFERQMMWLKQNVDLVSLGEIQNRMRGGQNDRVAVAVTFDDGYAENLQRAIPFLIDHKIPVTYFVALDFVVNRRTFPHDADAGVPLAVNTPEQIRQMVAAGIQIGAHTRNHTDVGAIDCPRTMIDEIVTASDELGKLAGQPIRYFAFPYGQTENLSATAAHLAKQHGMHGVCSAYGAYNFPGDDPFHLQRLHADPEFIRLKNWVTIDRRKIAHGRGFEFPETAVTIADVAAAANIGNTPGLIMDSIQGIPTPNSMH